MSIDAFRTLAASGKPAIAFVVHGWGGGIRRHVDDLAVLVGPAANVVFVEPADGTTVRLRIAASDVCAYFKLPRDFGTLAKLMRAIGVVRLHFHHVNGLPRDVLELPTIVDLPFDVTLHDYVTICPQLHLVTSDGRYCGEPAEPGCAACLAGRPPPWPLDIIGWRAAFAALLRHAARVIAPSQDVASRILRYVPDLKIEVWPHPESTLTVPHVARVATLGTLSREKGLEVVVACATDAHARSLPLAFRILGAVGAPLPPLPPSRVSLAGEYAEQELPRLVAAERPDLLWFPAQVPETYAYTMSVALASGLPIVASDLGALRERLNRHPNVRIVRWDAAPSEWNDALLALAPLAGIPLELDPGMPALQYRERYLAPLAAVPARGAEWLAIEERHFVAPADARRPDLSFAELVTAGVLCGKAEARGELVRRVARADLDFAELHARQAGLIAGLAEAERDTAAARERAEALETSTTWRMTAPARSLAHRVKVSGARARAGWRGVGRLPQQASLAMTLLRDEGPRAVGARIMRKLQGGGRFRPARPTPYHQADRVTALAFLPVAAPRVSIVIPAYGKPLLTFTCLASVHANTAPNDYEVIVVDDASPEPLSDALAEVSGIQLERNPSNLGFIGSCNRGAELARGELLVLLNNDTIVTKGWLEALLQVFEMHADAGLVGGKLIYPDGRLQEAGGIVWRDGSAWNVGRDDDPDRPEYNYLREADYCSGACLALPSALFRELGGFDRRYAPAYYEDTDLAFSVRERGLKVYYQPAATIVHFEGQTSGTDVDAGAKRHQALNRVVFRDKWANGLAAHRSNGMRPELERDRRAARRVLVIDACMITPDQDSGSVRALAMLELMVEAGSKVTFVADNLEYRQPYVDQLQQRGVEVVFSPYARSVGELISKRGGDLDLVVLARHYIAVKHLDAVREFAPRALAAFDTVDLHFLRAERLATLEGSASASGAARSRREEELALIRRADVTIVVSPIERGILRELAPDARVLLLSNIHEPRRGGKSFAAREGLVFIGGFQHPPNTDGVLWYAHEILPRVRQRLPGVPTYIIGSKVPSTVRALAAPDFVVTGFLPDISPFFTGCRLSIAPLRYGAGVKGKVNLAMSYGLPVVATSPSVEGMHLAPGEDVLVADGPEAFAAAIERGYRDEALWTKLSTNSVANIERHFSRAVARAALAELFAAVDARKAG